MITDQIESFDYFVGKVCSVHTRPLNWRLDDDATVAYYVGVVNSVNECGVCVTNVVNGNKTFIMMPHVVAIAEESVVDREDPGTEKMLRDLEERKKQIYAQAPAPPKERPLQQVGGSPFVDLDSITQFAKRAKGELK